MPSQGRKRLLLRPTSSMCDRVPFPAAREHSFRAWLCICYKYNCTIQTRLSLAPAYVESLGTRLDVGL